MSDLLTGRGVQGCGAGPGREPVPIRELGDVTDVGQGPGRDDGSEPWRSISREPRTLTITLSSEVDFLIFASTATRSASSSAAIRRRGFPAMSRGRTVARIALACRAARSCLPWPGTSSARSRWSRLHR